MPITDEFKSFTPTMGDPVGQAQPVVPDDNTDLLYLTRALYVGVAGDVKVTLAGGAVATFAAMTAGWHPLRVARVHATGTTATHIIGCW